MADFDRVLATNLRGPFLCMKYEIPAMASHFPLNSIADPDDMARAALFLLSDESRYTTGTVFPCEGGITAG